MDQTSIDKLMAQRAELEAQLTYLIANGASDASKEGVAEQINEISNVLAAHARTQ